MTATPQTEITLAMLLEYGRDLHLNRSTLMREHGWVTAEEVIEAADMFLQERAVDAFAVETIEDADTLREIAS